ncbi:MAG: ribosomal protein S18-alanine N-acetyltransferase [Sedimenticola sp.]|nr:ribosomal protein S18-alanine N-acetyltransferase [Sedimenticola sp.]
MSAILKDPLLQLKKLREDDLDAIMAVELRCYQHPWTAGIFRDSLRVGYSCWGCFLGQQLLGYGIMSVAAGEAHLLNICVDPRYRGQGLARRLIQRLISQARERDADTLFLEVRVSNRVAQGLYGSLGFNEIGQRRGYYPASGGREDAILFAKVL